MRAVVQRVSEAEVRIGSEIVGAIGAGLLVYIGIAPEDDGTDVKYLADKICALRIFGDENGKMNISLNDIGGGLLCISQFTLYADCRKGNRPSFTAAASPEKAQKLYDFFCNYLKDKGIIVGTGEFGADMKVKSINDGPVTIIIESK